MSSNTVLVIASIVAVVFAFIFLVLVVRRSQIVTKLSEPKKGSKSTDGGWAGILKTSAPATDMQPDVDPRSETDELQATPVSELIEDVVKQKLQDHPALRDVVIDFGTSPDGSLEIWIDSERYLDVEDIPDKRIRDAIAEAVREFNI